MGGSGMAIYLKRKTIQRQIHAKYQKLEKQDTLLKKYPILLSKYRTLDLKFPWIL